MIPVACQALQIPDIRRRSLIEAFFSGWRSSAHGSSEWLIRQGQDQYEMFLHAPKKGLLKYPTMHIYRTLFGAASPWFSSYVCKMEVIHRRIPTGDPIYDILDLHVPDRSRLVYEPHRCVHLTSS